MNIKKFIAALTACTTEEAVKATFIKHAGFTAYIKERVDLYVEPVLFEFKYDIKCMVNDNWYATLAQALIYVHRIQNGVIQVPMPTHVALVDKNEGMLFPLDTNLMGVVAHKKLKWNTPASKPDKKLIQVLKDLPSIAHTNYDLSAEHGLEDFLRDLKTPPGVSTITSYKKIVSVANFNQVYDDWTRQIGACLVGVKNLGPYFVADLREDAVFGKGKLVFPFSGESFQIPVKTYDSFWDMYGRPPAADVQNLILNQLHMFAPDADRRREGAFYTPKWVAEKAIEYLDNALPGWQDDPNTYLWDPCCGTGNLEEPLKGYDRVFMSTLDMNEVCLLKDMNLFPGAHIFQFDFLNGDYDDLPLDLRLVIEHPTKKLIVLMNPPYGEATAGVATGSNKTGVSFTRAKEEMVAKYDLGKAANELFTQFMYRVHEWVPKAVIGTFATLKYMNSPVFEKFRDRVFDYGVLNGFLVPGTVFPGVKGKFPVSFVVWKRPGAFFQAQLVVFNQTQNAQGTKLVADGRDYLNAWFKRPKATEPAIPLTSALSVDTKENLRCTTLPPKTFGYAGLNSNDPQHSQVVFYVSSISSSGNGCAITPETFEQVLTQVAVRKTIKPTWLNWGDQFQVPCCDRTTYKKNTAPGNTSLPRDFVTNCVVYALFHDKNHTSAWTPEYKGKPVTIDNQFYPWPIADVQPWVVNDLNLSRQLSRAKDTFVANWLSQQTFSPEAQAVLDAGKAVYEAYYQELPNLMQAQWKLEAWNVGWYQIRMALKQADLAQGLMKVLKGAEEKLRLRLEPDVYVLGFLEK